MTTSMLMNIPVYVLIILASICVIIALSSIVIMTISQYKIMHAKERIDAEIENFDIIYISNKTKDKWQSIYKKIKITAMIALTITMIIVIAYSHLCTIAEQKGIDDVNNQSIYELIKE